MTAELSPDALQELRGLRDALHVRSRGLDSAESSDELTTLLRRGFAETLIDDCGWLYARITEAGLDELARRDRERLAAVVPTQEADRG